MYEVFQWYDLVLAPFWFFIFFWIGSYIKNKYLRNDPVSKYYMYALVGKMVGAICVGLVYQYYYYGGDTIYYYFLANKIANAYIDNPLYLLDIYTYDVVLSPVNEYEPFIIDTFGTSTILRDPNIFFVAKVYSFIVVLALGSYYGAAVITGAVTFFCVFLLYRVFTDNYPALHRQMAVAVFFIPSTIFWGSGILKDSITFSFLSLYLFQMNSILRGKGWILFRILIIIVSVYVIFKIKPYIALSFVPLSLIWVGTYLQGKIDNMLARLMLAPFVLIVTLVSGWFALNYLSEQTTLYSLDNVLNYAEAANNDLSSDYYYQEGGSRYFIGQFEPTLTSILSLFPVAVWTTFFRPNPWEVNTVIVFFALIESYVFLAFFIRVLIRANPIKFLKYIFNSAFLFFIFSFSITFAFFVGLTSGNYGNLVRYKIPCLPFFAASLFIIEYMAKKNTSKNYASNLS